MADRFGEAESVAGSTDYRRPFSGQENIRNDLIVSNTFTSP